MDNILIAVLFFLIVVIAIALVCLFKENKQLKADYNDLRGYVDRNNKDIAGLCSAAVTVDNRLSENNNQLKEMVDKVADFELQEQQTSQPYHSAIQRVRNGANAEELIQQCGVSREEAVLLIRLHGKSEG